MSSCTGWPTATLRVSIVSPSRRTVTCAVPPEEPWSSTRKVTACAWLTMPKRGALRSATRRSRSSFVPVISACSGAAKPSAAASAGTSCTRPSVRRIAPATRSGGTSASAEPSAENRRVPSVSPSDWPASTVRTSSPEIRPSRSISAARAVSVCCRRSPKFWLGLLSTTTTATEVSGSRSSRVKEGFASASTISSSAIVRTTAPRLRAKNSSPATISATARPAHTT